MSSQTTEYTPGQTITCTIESAPVAEAPKKTISRLMRRDPEIKKGLRRAQNLRRARMHTYIRGNKLWYSREKAAQIARCEVGNSWTMAYTPDIAADLASVEKHLKITGG